MLLFRTHFIHPKKMPSTMSCSMGNLLLLNIRLYSCIIYYQIKIYSSSSSRIYARFEVAIEETILFFKADLLTFSLYLLILIQLFNAFLFTVLLFLFQFKNTYLLLIVVLQYMLQIQKVLNFNFVPPKVNTDYIRQAQVLNIDNLRKIILLMNFLMKT